MFSRFVQTGVSEFKRTHSLESVILDGGCMRSKLIMSKYPGLPRRGFQRSAAWSVLIGDELETSNAFTLPDQEESP